MSRWYGMMNCGAVVGDDCEACEATGVETIPQQTLYLGLGQTDSI